jgi:cytochrome c oxidase cbb3-type subunit 4
MDNAYAAVAHFAQTWGLIYFFVVFCAVVVFVMLPSRKKRYDDAARMPLRED